MAELILVVDDEPVQRRLVEAILEKLDYKVLCVDGGQAAIDALTGKNANAIKAVILDLVMPDIDGLAVLGAMETHGITQPVIIQTAQGGVETAVNLVGISDAVRIKRIRLLLILYVCLFPRFCV